MFNTTHATGSINTSLSYNVTRGTISASSQTLKMDPANNLGYGIGKIVRGSFDHLYHSGQKIWAGELSSDELAMRRQIKIYRQGLRECALQLDSALDKMLKNPHALSSFKRVQSVATHYAPYLKPEKREELRAIQQKTLQPLEKKISNLAHPHIRNALMQLLPIVFQESNPVKASAEKDTRSYLKQGAVSAKPKRALQQSGGWPASFDLKTLNGANGFKVDGLGSGDLLGWSVSTAGDLNGDGKTDLVLGAFGASPGGRSQAGTVYILFGQTSGWSPSFNLTTLNGANGFKVDGLGSGNPLGYSVSTAGDLNGDGKADLVLGANRASPEGRSWAGTAYILFGQASGWSPSFNLTTLNGTNGFKVDGLAMGNNLGFSVSTAGDLNGDGKDDLVLGANLASPGGRKQAGTAYVLFRQMSGWPPSFDLTTLDGTNGFKVDGLARNDELGYSVSTAGDLNGDGKADLVLGASGSFPGARAYAGTAYILFGKTSGWPPSFNLATLDGTNGFKVDGLVAYDHLGTSVSTAGDLNVDGMADLVLGAYTASPGGRAYAGTAYVLFGQASGWPPSFDLTTLNGTNGFKVDGLAALDGLGWSASTAGDLNGDGKADLMLGAITASPGGRNWAGTVYILFGQKSGWFPSFNLTTLNGANGFKVDGLAECDILSRSVSTAGDFNGDGFFDLVLGAPDTTIFPNQSVKENGTAYIIFGRNMTLLTSSSTPPLSPISGSTSSVSPTSITQLSTVTPTPSPTLGSSSTPNSLIDVPTPAANDHTIGIAAGIGGAVLLGLAGIVGLLWHKKKACFAGRSGYRVLQINEAVKQDLEDFSLISKSGNDVS